MPPACWARGRSAKAACCPIRCCGPLFFGGLATLLAVSGPLTFVRQILRKWGIWLLLAACIWLTWNLFAKADLAALVGAGR